MIKLRNYLNECGVLLSVSLSVLLFVSGCAATMDGNIKSSEMDLSSDSKEIYSVTTEQSDEKFNVILKGSDNLSFTSVKQPFPTGVILYFPNTKLNGIKNKLDFKDGIVETIKFSDYKQGNKTARVEILLKQDVGYQVTKSDEGLLISFNQNNSESVQSVIPPASKKDANTISPAVFSDNSKQMFTADTDLDNLGAKSNASLNTVIPVKMASAVNNDSGQVPEEPEGAINDSNSENIAWMNRIDFSSESDGKSTLIIGTTVSVQYEVQRVSPTKLEVRLFNTNVPKYRQRPLITTRFKSAVDRIMPFQTMSTGSTSVISIELREDVPYFVEQTSSLLMVHFEASTIEPRPLQEANLPDWQQVIMQTTIEPVPLADEKVDHVANNSEVVDNSDAFESENTVETVPTSDQKEMNSQINAAGQFGSGAKKYIGEKVALDFYKTDIKNVFRILREVSGKNFAIDKDVNGSVTLTLDKPVPWDQVMDLILKMNQLGMIYERDIIRIATLETLRREEEQRSAQLEAVKKAQQQKISLEPLFTEYIPVNYSNASTEVLPHVQNILSKERGSVSVDNRNNQIIITDTKDVIRQARDLVKRIDKVTPQVVIEARIVEVSSTFSRDLGIEWDSQVGATGSDFLDMDVTGNMAMDFPASSASSVIGINFSRLDGVPFVLNAQLNALETTGDGKILSSPKIVTLDNKKARIKQGLEYPYLERDDAGGSSVSFKNIDLLLEVTPHVTPDNRISMNIFITKNDVAGLTDGVPSISTNEAETELLINDGDTIVIGGIIKKSESGGQSGFPGLSKIPVLGWLFKNTTRSDQKNELLIFMTPRIVQLEQL